MTIKCIFQGCNTTPSYNTLGQKSPIYCVSHKEADMVRVRVRIQKISEY